MGNFGFLRSAGVFFIFLLVLAGGAAAADEGSGDRATDLTILPFVYYTPETRTAFVLTGIYTWRDPAKPSRPSSILGFVTYTSQNQRIISFFPEVFTGPGAKIVLRVSAMDFPDKFFGIGEDTLENDGEDYSRTGYRLDVSLQFEVLPNLFAGLRYDWEDLSIEDVEPGGLLDSGLIHGTGGGVTAGAGFLITYDSRDDIFMPSKGVYAELTAMSYGQAAGGDFEFDNVIADLRQFITPGQWTLAFNQYLHLSSGEPPFDRLAQLGGPRIMRGYFQGRFRDKNMAAVQVESRFPLSSRFGWVLFGSAGNVAESPRNLGESDLLTALGTGLRYRLSKAEAINFRVDLAWGEDGSRGAYFTIREAF